MYVGCVPEQNETFSGVFGPGCKETISIHEPDEPGPLARKKVYSETA